MRSSLPVLAAAVATALGLLGQHTAVAQVRRPADDRPEAPRFEPPPAEEPELRLPAPPLPAPEPPPGAVSRDVRVLVREIVVTGVSDLPDLDEEIDRIVAAYTDRFLSFADVQALRDELTLAYVERGYVTSGAVIPPQQVDDGVLELRIVEGVLAGLEIETDGRLRERVVRGHLERAAGRPLDAYALEEALRLLQQEPYVERVDARLVPGERRGESTLRVAVVEAPPYRVGAEFNNYNPPAIGSYGGEFDGSLRNLAGLGDQLAASYEVTQGLNSIDTFYEVPVNARDTSFDVHFYGSWSDVVEEPFDSLDIAGNSYTVGATVRHPFYRTLSDEISGFVIFDYRRSLTTLFGEPFSFVPGPDDGRASVSVLRFGQEWLHRSREQAIALRSTISWGFDAFDATRHPDHEVPDGLFLAWLAQAQWARRLPWYGIELVGRGDVQLSSAPLLGMEQFPVGGHASVRGYRENQLVGDQGLVLSLEARIPLWRRHTGVPIVDLVPFVDYGRSWNKDRPTLREKDLLGIGAGVRWRITAWSGLEIFYGREILPIHDPGGWDLQDTGIQFRLRVEWPP